MRLQPALLATALCVLAFAPIGAQAGRSCVNDEVTAAEVQSAVQVAEDAKKILGSKPARFALIARVGSDISEHGLRYTHAGFVRKRPSDGAWVVVHQLTSCGKTGSGLFVQGLGAFMLDDLLTHDVLLITLPEKLARRLENVFAEGAPRRIYDPRYSMISYPGSPAKYQNSNQWVLELIAVAQAGMEGVTLRTRDEIHRYYRDRGFAGSTIRISPLRRSLVRLSARNIRFDDHPPESHRSGRYEVVSVKSVVAYLRHTGHAEERFTISGPYRRTDRSRETTADSPNGD